MLLTPIKVVRESSVSALAARVRAGADRARRG